MYHMGGAFYNKCAIGFFSILAPKLFQHLESTGSCGLREAGVRVCLVHTLYVVTVHLSNLLFLIQCCQQQAVSSKGLMLWLRQLVPRVHAVGLS